VLKMCGLKYYVVAKEGGKMADFYYDSHILGTKLQAYLFDPDIEAKDVSIPDSTSTEYMEISPEIIEELPNAQEPEAEEHRSKKRHDSLPSSDEDKDKDEDEDGEDVAADEEEESDEDGVAKTEDEEDSECDNEDEEDKASEPEAVLLKNSRKCRKLVHAPESMDGEREEAQHSPLAQKSPSDVSITEIEAAAGPEIAVGNYLKPNRIQLQAATTENEEANAEAFSAMQIGSNPIGPNQEQFDDRDGPLEATSEIENPTLGIHPSNTETMEVSPPQVSTATKVVAIRGTRTHTNFQEVPSSTRKLTCASPRERNIVRWPSWVWRTVWMKVLCTIRIVHASMMRAATTVQHGWWVRRKTSSLVSSDKTRALMSWLLLVMVILWSGILELPP
jgi:hypothetical protein